MHRAALVAAGSSHQDHHPSEGHNDTGHQPAILAAGVRKAFGETTVSEGVDLSVAEGSIFALLGPNGAGKTTMIGSSRR